MTQSETYDIIVSGGGVAGLSAAAAFGTAGFTVLCVDPAPPVTERDAEGRAVESIVRRRRSRSGSASRRAASVSAAGS